MSLTATTSMIDGRFRLGEEVARGDDASGQDGSADRASSPLRIDEARVFRAEDLQTGQTVAIKILTQASSKHADFRSRFQRDAAIMRSFDHPHVVATIAAGITAEGQPYFAMEFLQGQTLAAKIARSGPIPPLEMAQYLREVAAALDAAHARGILHRDINPNAVMILDQPTPEVSVKLLDFGLAKDLSKPAGSQVELTSKQTSLGQAAYLSPEQARGGEVDERSTVYALGVTLYEALTGRLPFEGETDFQILLAKINGRIPPFPENWSDHPNPSAIEAVVLQALATNASDRPATAGTLAKLFEEALESRPARKHSISWPLVTGGLALVLLLIFVAKWLL